MSNKYLTKEEMEEIVADISLDYKDMDLNINIISRRDFLAKNYDYFVNSEENKSVIKKLKSCVYMLLIKGVCYDINDSIDIVYNSKNFLSNRETKIFDLIFCCYHEIRHREQSNFSSYSYSGFLRDLEYFLNNIDISNYRENSYTFSYEIGANLYAIDKTSRYLYKNYPKIYNSKREILEKKYNGTIINYLLYNSEAIINNSIILYEYMLSINKSRKIDSDFVSPVFKMFFEDDGTLKTIKEIVNDPDFSKLDKRIFYEIVGSSYFVEDIVRNKKLAEEEKNIFDKVLEYKRNIFSNQQKCYMEYKKKLKKR